MCRSLRIAIADDEPLFFSHVQKMLKGLGHEVISQSENGSDLVDQCRLLKPDLIVTDVTMPQLDGTDYVVARLPKPIDTGQLAAAIRSEFPSFDGD